MTVGSIISGGFGLLRSRPGAVAVWGFVYMLLSIALFFTTRAMTGSGRPGAPEASAVVGSTLLGQLASMIVLTILLAAAQRAVLRPERQGFAYLGLGMDELRLIALSLILVVLGYVGIAVVAIVVALLIATAGFATESSPTPLFIGLGLLILVLMAWYAVRVSLAFPLTLLRGKIIIGEAWRATRGRFWTLFGAFALIFLLLLVLSIPAALIASGPYWAELIDSGFASEGAQAAAERQMARQLGEITAETVAGWLLAGLMGGLSVAVYGGALGTAARELTTDFDRLVETFA